MQNFSLLPLSRDFSRPIAWGFSFNLGIFRNNILGFSKIQSGTTYCVVGMGRFSRYHGIPRTIFSRYQNRQGHGIIRHYSLLPYYKWNKYLH